MASRQQTMLTRLHRVRTLQLNLTMAEEARAQERVATEQQLSHRIGQLIQAVSPTPTPSASAASLMASAHFRHRLIESADAATRRVEVAEQLSRDSELSVQVVSMHTVKPLDEECLAEAFSRTAVVATIEEHSVIGGLGGAVSEWLATQPPRKARLLRIGTADSFLHEAGDQQHARRRFGLLPEAIASRVLKFARSDARLP